jgi:hypothetical protein
MVGVYYVDCIDFNVEWCIPRRDSGFGVTGHRFFKIDEKKPHFSTFFSQSRCNSHTHPLPNVISDCSRMR